MCVSLIASNDSIGRTGRFGRQGISINFVHDKLSFQHMEAIRNVLGKPIVRVETNDFEQMEKVSNSSRRESHR